MQLTMSIENEKAQPVTVTNAQVTQKDRRPLLFLISALVIVLDRVTKNAIVHRIRPGYSIPVIPGVFHLSHVINTGAAFSLMENWQPGKVRYGLIAFSVVAAVVLLTLMWRTGKQFTATSVALALILGGAMGNLYDRIRLHHVVDFLAVTIYHYHWPDFNVADSCIVIGACLLLLEIFRPDPQNHPVA